MKVKKKKALKVSLISALVIGLIHYITHQFTDSVMVVGFVVILTTFLIGYFGMTK